MATVGEAELDFFARLRPLSGFAAVLDPDSFAPLPGGWLVGVADIVDSTGAIAAGRYKAVNMVGAGVISGVLNLIGHAPFPYVFGGDGAAFALPQRFEPQLRQVLATTCTWAREEMGLDLRAALLPVEEVRAAGHDVTVARYQPNEDVAYAMFAGGGIAWAEAEMKAGRNRIPPAPPGSRPDLAGLSCRWSPSRARRGIILSLLALPVEGAEAAFSQLGREILARLRRLDDGGRPMPTEGPRFSWRAPGLALEARVPVGAARQPQPKWKLFVFTLFAWTLFLTGLKAGAFDPRRYRSRVVANADYRKFDDGLKLTVDCAPEEADAIEALLDEGRGKGICDYGVYRQDAALITCVVPSYVRDDHFHFIDGAGGGYAAAALALKRSRRAAGGAPGA